MKVVLLFVVMVRIFALSKEGKSFVVTGWHQDTCSYTNFPFGARPNLWFGVSLYKTKNRQTKRISTKHACPMFFEAIHTHSGEATRFGYISINGTDMDGCGFTADAPCRTLVRVMSALSSIPGEISHIYPLPAESQNVYQPDTNNSHVVLLDKIIVDGAFGEFRNPCASILHEEQRFLFI